MSPVYRGLYTVFEQNQLGILKSIASALTIQSFPLDRLVTSIQYLELKRPNIVQYSEQRIA